MARIAEWLEKMDTRARLALVPGVPADDAILALMVHMASIDGVVRPEELTLLARVLPGRSSDALADWVARVVASPLDYEALRRALVTEDDRWKALRYTTRMAVRDRDLAEAEIAFLDRLARALSLPDNAVAKVSVEMTSRMTERVDGTELERTLKSIGWDAVQFADGEIASPDLVPYVPTDAHIVARIGVDKVEVMGVYEEGLVARFLEGPAFLTWRDIIACTHGSGLAESVRIHTEDGATRTFADRRLNGVVALIERMWIPEPPRNARPTVERRRGAAPESA